MKDQIVFALDIGSTKIACVAAEFSADGTMRPLGCRTIEHKGMQRGIVQDLEATAMAVSDSVRDVQQQAGSVATELAVSVGGPHVEGINTQGIVPIVPRSRVINRDDILQVINHSRQVMMPPDREMIQALPREFRVDGQRGVQKPVGMSGSKLEVYTYILTGQTTHLSNLDRSIQMAGYKINPMIFGPMAAGAAVLSPDEHQLGCVLVDLGGGTTDVAVFVGGTVTSSSSVPIGGSHVTSDLSLLLKTAPEEAERLKLRHGSASARNIDEDETVDVHQLGQSQPRPMNRKVLCEIIESRMREIALIVRQQIEKSGMNGMLPGGVILTGQASLLPNTVEVFEGVLQHMRARIGAPKTEGPLAQKLNVPGMSTAVGLAALAGISEEDELGPATGFDHWKEKIKSLRTILGGK